MKIFLSYLIIIAALPCCGQKEKKTAPASMDSLIPEKPAGWVSDFEKIFTPEQVNYLDSFINQHEKETDNEIAVVTLSLDSLQVRTAEEFNQFAFSLFAKWGIGKRDKSNGIGFLISGNLKRIRIETGKGLVAKLTNDEAQQIIDSLMVPEFRAGNYYAGILKGLEAVIKELK